MHTAGKVFIWLNVVVALALFPVTAYVLGVWQTQRDLYNRARKVHEATQAKFIQVNEGDAHKAIAGMAELRSALARELAHRGRAWFNCVKTRYDANTQAVGVHIDQPRPAEIHENDILYVFEQVSATVRPEPGDGARTALQVYSTADIPGGGVGNPPRRFLGEFRVTQVDPANNDISLEPTMLLLLPDYTRRLAESQGPWALYETMPQDSVTPFVGIDENTIKALMPIMENEPAPQFGERTLAQITAATHQQYLRHGKEPEADDPPLRVVVRVKFTKDLADLDDAAKQKLSELQIAGEKLVVKDQQANFTQDVAQELIGTLRIAEEVKREYHRPLNDYLLAIRHFNRVIPEQRNAVASATFHADSSERSAAEAAAYLLQREEEKQRLTAERNRLNEERQTVTAYATELEQKVAAIQQEIDSLRQENLRLAKLLAEQQSRVAGQAAVTSKAATDGTE